MQTSGKAMVYHLPHQVGDDNMPLDEPALFSQTLNAIVEGFVPFEDGRKLAARRGFARCHEGRMEERTLLLLGLSLNPLSLVGRAMPSLRSLQEVFALFNLDAPQQGVRNWLDVHDGKLSFRWEINVELTRQEYLLVNESVSCLFDVTRRHIVGELREAPLVPTDEPLGFATMRALGESLNRRHTAEFALIEVLGENPDIQAEAAARAVGCSGRTLQRQLQASGLSLPRLRLAGKLLRGVGLLCRGGPLSDIAAEAGFSDYSHFARTLGRSCGFRPTTFQRAMASLDMPRLQDARRMQGAAFLQDAPC